MGVGRIVISVVGTRPRPPSGTACSGSRSPNRRAASPGRFRCARIAALSRPAESIREEEPMGIIDRVGAVLPWESERGEAPSDRNEVLALRDGLDRWRSRLIEEPPGLGGLGA